LVKAALATDMLGFCAKEIATLDHDTEDEHIAGSMAGKTGIFFECRDLWQKNGFIRMLNRMLRQTRVLPRLMKFPDGERRCTNLLHLAEVLHETAVSADYGMVTLIKWLDRQLNKATRETKEQPLRLDSDDQAVNIITIHKSKGLEFPIVFSPFLWNPVGQPDPGKGLVFHDEDNHMKPVVDFRSIDDKTRQNLKQAQKEQYAEDMRLIYVALTRAKNRCYVSYVPHGKAGPSPFSALCGDDDGVSVLQNLRNISAASGQSLSAVAVSPEDITGRKLGVVPQSLDKKLSCRKFSRSIPADWRVLSFSHMSRHTKYDQDRITEQASLSPDENRFFTDDEDAALPDVFNSDDSLAVDEFEKIMHFPKGAATGLFMHKIFEDLDVTCDDTDTLNLLVSEGLRRFDFEKRWHSVVCDMVRNVLGAKFHSPDGVQEFCLGDIAIHERINELEFYFPINNVSAQGVGRVYRQAGGNLPDTDFAGRIENLDFYPSTGFMKGFIDLVFFMDGRYYLLDWKSNFLGHQLTDYRPENLYGTMADSYYLLQAHIYTVALNCYLQRRVPGYDYESGFGGVYYVFLRGVRQSLGSKYGVYCEKPPAALIQKMTEYLIPDFKQGVK